MNLHAISYTSAAVKLPTRGQMIHLLQKARERNALEGVTGVLLYADGTFHQYIEGPRSGLLRVYEAITRDPLHHQIFEIVNEPIQQREFSAWSMGFRGEGRPDSSADEVALTRLLADESPRLSAGRLLLNAFWSKAMGGRAQATLADHTL